MGLQEKMRSQKMIMVETTVTVPMAQAISSYGLLPGWMPGQEGDGLHAHRAHCPEVEQALRRERVEEAAEVHSAGANWMCAPVPCLTTAI